MQPLPGLVEGGFADPGTAAGVADPAAAAAAATAAAADIFLFLPLAEVPSVFFNLPIAKLSVVVPKK